jgi:hypothetical protein
MRLLNLLLAAAVGVALVVGLVLLLGVSRHRRFQVDEVEHLHAAYNLRDGRMIYRDFWQGHPPLLYAMIAPLTDVRDPVATYLRARMLLAALLLGTIALAALCAARLGGGWAGALAGTLALLQTTMIERGIEVRPDGPLALLIMAALAIELAPRMPPLRRYSIEALLLGVGVLLTQKAVFPLAPFAVLWIIDAWRARRPRLAIQPLLLAATPFVAAWAILASLGAGDTFIRYVFLNATSAATRAENRGTFGPEMFLVRESARNVAFVAAALLGIAVLAVRRRDRAAMFTIALTAFSIATLWLNPFPWPYVHVTFIPLLAVCAGAGVMTIAPARWRGAVAVGVIALAMLTSMPRLMQKASDSTDLQFATLREIERVTPRDGRCFDLAGLYFRPDAYPVYAMSGDMLVSYAHGAFPRIIPELRGNGVACVLYNYRTAALPAAEQQFIAAHFVRSGGNLFLPGADLSRAATGDTVSLETLADDRFRYEGGGAITVDGAPFVRGALARGVHAIRVVRAAAGAKLIIDSPPPALAGPPGEIFPPFD